MLKQPAMVQALSTAFILLLIVVVAGMLSGLIPVLELAAWTIEYVERSGPQAAAVFLFGYMLSGIFFLPGSLLTFASASLFGLPLGILLSNLGATIAACSGFSASRFVWSKKVVEFLETRPKLMAFNNAVKNKAFLLIALSRLSFVFPFHLINYSLGVSSVSFPVFAAATFLGALPSTALFVLLGAFGADIAGINGQNSFQLPPPFDTPQFETFFLLSGIVLAVVVSLLVGRETKRQFKELQASKAA